MRLHGVVCSLVVMGLLWPACGQGLGDRVTLAGAMSPTAALTQVAQQTGVRIAGLNGLPADHTYPLKFEGTLPAALRYVTSATGVMVNRAGLYDYIAFPRPQVPVLPLPAATLGDLTLRLSGMVCPFKAGTRELDDPLRLVVDLRLEADTDLALGRLQRVDAATCRLTDDTGVEVAPLTALLRPVDQRRCRIGYLQPLPFPLPAAGAHTASLHGELLCFEEARPINFQLAPQAPGEPIERDGLRVQLTRLAPGVGGWTGTLLLRRELVLGEDEPWLDLAVHGSDKRLYRPRELSFQPLETTAPGDGDDEVPAPAQAGSSCRFDLPLPAGVSPARLDLQVLVRKRPWARVPFTLTGLQLPDLRVQGRGTAR